MKKKQQTKTILVLDAFNTIILPKHRSIDYLKKCAKEHYLSEGHSLDGLWVKYKEVDNANDFILVSNTNEHIHTYWVKTVIVL